VDSLRGDAELAANGHAGEYDISGSRDFAVVAGVSANTGGGLLKRSEAAIAQAAENIVALRTEARTLIIYLINQAAKDAARQGRKIRHES
jgi:hypothetical protein